MTIEWRVISQCMSLNRHIVAAWVFGSAREGTIRVRGDVDVGVLFGGKPSLDELVELRMCLQDVLAFEDIDLVVLNDASPILRFEAVSGRPVYVADRERCAAFVSMTVREYEDEMAQWRKAMAAWGEGCHSGTSPFPKREKASVTVGKACAIGD